MQTSSRGIILDQLQQAYPAAPDTSSLVSGEIDSTTDPALNALALLDTILRELLPTASLAQIVRALVEKTRQALDMDLCLLMLADSTHSQLTIQATSPDLNGRLLTIPPLNVSPGLWEKLCATPGQMPELRAHEKEQLNPLKNVQYENLYCVPLSAGSAGSAANECVGLLNCYSSKARDLDRQERLVLQTIGNFAAISIYNRQLIDAAASTVSVKSFFDDILAGNSALEDSLRGRAAALGCDWAQPHVMLMLEIARIVDDREQSETRANWQAACRYALKLVEQRMQARYSGSLFDEREHRLYALVAHAGDATARELKVWLDALVQQVESDMQISLFAGVSNACHDLRDYHGGFAQAEEALAIAQCLNARAASMHFSDLGAYRYVYAFARDHTRHDLYLDQVAAIAHYDHEHKRAELLDTLEVYLARRGNIKEASEVLDVHRNTLTQRLERMQALCAVNLDLYSNWLPLQVAIMIHRLRAQLLTRGQRHEDVSRFQD